MKKKINKNLPYFDEKGRLINSHCFKEVGEFYNKHGVYCLHAPKTLNYDKFWKGEIEKCLDGVTIGEVRITGYNYFFLNFYRMTVPKKLENGKVVTIQDFPTFLLLHWNMFNLIEYCELNDKNLVLTKPRGAGISEVFASIGVRDFFFSKEMNREKLFKNNAYFASDEAYISPKIKGSIMEKMNNAIDWLNNTDIDGNNIYQPSSYNNDSGRKAGIKQMNGSDTVEVTKGGTISIKHIPKGKSDKARGNRQDKIMFEESGAFPDLLKTLDVSMDLVQRVGIITGNIFCWGTTNESDEGLEGLKNLFYNPNSRKFLCFKNVFEDVLSEKDLSKIPYDYRELIVKEGVGLFFPSFDANLNFIDKHGNPLREKGYQYYIEERTKLEGSNNLYSFIGEHPLKPTEAFKRTGSNFFNSELLAKQLSDLTLHKTKKLPNCYNLSADYYDNVTATKVNNSGLSILEMPETTLTGEVVSNQYVIGYDGIDIGTDNSEVGKDGSKMCAIVYKRYSTGYSFLPVAMYLERPKDERLGFDIVYKLALFYNAKIMIEDTKRGIVTYIRDVKKKPNMFFKRPKFLLTTKKVNNKIGITATEENIKKYLENIAFYIEDYYYNLHFPDLVEQLLQYTWEDKKRFDTVAAFGMALLAHESVPLSPEKEEKQENSYYAWVKDKDGVISFKKVVEEKNKEVKYFDMNTKQYVYER